MLKTLKRTTEEVAEYFLQQGCELLDEYVGCQKHMKYKCSCGTISHITWNNFSRGRRCGYCGLTGRKKKYSLEEVREIFRERGCEFLDTEFKGIHHKYHYRCKCGQEAEIDFAAFYHQKQNCKECGFEKLRKSRLKTNFKRGSDHYCWQPDREQLALNRKLRQKCCKMLSSTLKATGKSKIGHTSDMLGYGPKELQEHVVSHPNWNSIKNGSWHLDHIFPIQAFIDYGITDLKLINSLDNLQPLTQSENNKKKDKYNKDDFEQWLKIKNYTVSTK